MKTSIYIFALLCMLCVFSQGQSQVSNNGAAKESFTMVSFPDFFNFDVPEPWPQWDTSVNWFLEQVKNENPEFVMIAGDLVNGHWWDGPLCVKHLGTTYFNNWKRRVESHNLKYYVAIGDHELGDDPWPKSKTDLVPDFESVFANNLQMPKNGPEHKKGLAYYVRHENVLVVTLETFEIVDTTVIANVDKKQLDWFQKVLEDNSDADFVVVQGHVGIFGKPRSRSSSCLMLQDSTANPLWQVMKNGGVDIYLCGEFHDVTINERDGIWQIVHGSSWGRKIVDTQDYLVLTAQDNKLDLAMKSFAMEAQGEKIWNLHKPRGPREIVLISDETKAKGPQVTGTLTISKGKKGKKEFSNVTGVFKEFYK